MGVDFGWLCFRDTSYSLLPTSYVCVRSGGWLLLSMAFRIERLIPCASASDELFPRWVLTCLGCFLGLSRIRGGLWWVGRGWGVAVFQGCLPRSALGSQGPRLSLRWEVVRESGNPCAARVMGQQ